MKYAIVYSSTGNTKLLGDKVSEYLEGFGQNVYTGLTDKKALEADRIYLGFWTNRGICDNVSKDFISLLTNQEVFLFGSAGFGMKESYFKKIIKRTKKLLPKKVKLVGYFMCQGKMPMSVKEKYLKMKEQHKIFPPVNMLLKNFDMALSHPDENDFENLKKALIK